MRKIDSRSFMLIIMTAVFSAQVPASVSVGSSTNRPVVEAVKVINPIIIDGKLNEKDWDRPGATDFTQRDPNEGLQPTQKTEVWVCYDDQALYIAARLHDDHPDSIISRIGRRDASLISDLFAVYLDTYHDRMTGTYFAVSAGGSISDGTLYNDSWEDDTWDAVWTAATSIDKDGWNVEMKIPYSQLRFPKQEMYLWGVNFTRKIARSNERDDFVMVPKKESGWVSRFADLSGIHNINPPIKLEIVPYTASSGKFLLHAPGDPFNSGHDFSQNMGADIKYGLGSNLILNTTLNPDFGQVEVDPAVVNLTQYETYYDEKRPFFVEGSNFFDFGYGGANNNWGFNWGIPSFFYSRRVGRQPQGSVQHSGDFIENPDRTHIIGAAKLTGKIAGNWSLATMQAVTAREYAGTDSAGTRFSDVVEPLTYYSVVRSLKEFNEGRQAVGILGTATMRDLNEEYLAGEFNRNAFALAADGWTNLDADQVWVLTGWIGGTRVGGSSSRLISLQQSPLHYYQRKFLGYVSVDSSATSLTGYGGRIALNKQKGNSYLNAAMGFVTPGFDVNDLGYTTRTDLINMHLVTGYSWYEPDGFFRQKGFNVAAYQNYNFGRTSLGFTSDGRYVTNAGYFLFVNGTTMNYWGISGNISYSPFSYDLSLTRGGPPIMRLPNYNYNLEVWTDSRQPVMFDVNLGGIRVHSGSYEDYLSTTVTWKPSSGVSLSVSPSYDHNVASAQWVRQVDDPLATATDGVRYVFGFIDQREISASVRLDWTFTPTLSLQLYVQPLISVGHYYDYRELKQPATFSFNEYGIDNGSVLRYIDSSAQWYADPDGSGPAPSFTFANPDYNFKSLRGNLILRWEYLPGSTLYLVWTRQGANYDHPGIFDPLRDAGDLLGSASDNVFVVKASYGWNP